MSERGAYRQADGRPSFAATIMLSEGEGERPCVLVLEEHAVAAVVEDRVVAFVPLVDLQLEAGGFDADFLFVRGPGGYPSIATRDADFERALRRRAAEGPAALVQELADLRERQKELKSWKGFGVAFLASIFGLG